MKKFKKVFAVLLLMLLIAAPVVTAATQPVTVEDKDQTEKSKRQVLCLRKRKESLQQMAYH